MWIYIYLGLRLDSIDQAVCFMAISYAFYLYNSVVELEIRNVDTSRSLLLYRIFLVTLGFLFFHMKPQNLQPIICYFNNICCYKGAAEAEGVANQYQFSLRHMPGERAYP